MKTKHHRMGAGRVALLALATLLPAVEASAWWDKGWSHRRKLTFDNSGQPENLGNFPVLVVLDPSRIDYAKTRAGGIDIRFVDSNDQTLLSHEIERWTPGGTSYVWVRVPQVDASSNTDFMWMYYGNPTAPNAENIPFVWSPGFVMVHHLNETVSDGNHLDSATLDGANDASAILVQAQGTATGMIDGADSLVRPSNHRIEVSDSPSLDMAAGDSFTVEAWGRTNFSASYQMAFSKESRCGDPDPPPTACPDGDGEIQLWTDTGGQASFWLNDGAGNTARAGSAANIADDAWHYIVGRWNESAGVAEIFVDGVNVSIGGGQIPGTLGAIGTATPAVIGDEGDNNVGGGVGGAAWAGLLDEIRVSKALRSDNWIRAQNKSMRDNAFVLYGPEAAHCCGLGVTETATTITVNGPNRFDIRFNTATGGGIDRFVDAEENTGVDLAGGGPGLQPALFSDEVDDGFNATTAANTDGAAVHLLEATPARVRVRQDAFYQQGSTTAKIPALKGYGDYSIYGIGRMAIGWERRAMVAIPAPLLQQLQWAVAYTATAPLNAWTGYSQTAVPDPTPFGSGGGAPTATDDFVMAQSEVPGARTDFLAIASQDWSSANQVFFGLRAPENWQEVSWIDDNPAAPIALGSERWSFLTYFKPTTFTNNGDAAVTSRSADYRGPDSLSITLGNPWNDPAQLTGGDDFNEAEAAYLLTLDPDPGKGLTFQIDGTGALPRYSPFFKIRQWRSFQETPVVRLNGSLLTKDVNFRSAVKPLSRAHWASTLSYHCTMESTSACNAGNLDVGTGTGGSTSGTVTVQAGRYGNGLVFNENTDSVTAASSDFNRNIGAVEFWYQPFYNHNDGGQYLYWLNRGGSGPYDCYYFGKLTTNDLVFGVVSNATDPSCTIGGTSYMATAPAASYSWRAYDWVHLKTTWNSAGPVGKKLRIVLNGVEIASSGIFVAPDTSSTLIFGGCSLNCPGTPGANANGVLDEVHVYGGLELSAYDTNSPFAHAGLASDAGEYLADTAKNWSLGLTPVVADNKGSYLYFGADTPFRGLNVALQTPGVWSTTPGDLVWEFWNGTQWATLESGYGFTDQTLDFTRNGTIYWTGDPFNWSPYSVNGGPDLYYIRLHLAAGVLTYATQPMERQIKTDILLFQYCQDILAAAQEFAFAVPWATTEVKLQSFSAVPGDATVLLEWRTASELDNLGFHLYRSSSAEGPWTRLTSALIPGLGSSATGRDYSFRDSGLVNGARYFYRLEDVDTSSKSTFHGPVSTVTSPPAPAGGEGAGDGAGSRAKKKDTASASCPDWVLAAYGSLAGVSGSATRLTCSRHGDPEATSLVVVSRDARSATLELRTGGFYALHTLSGAGEPSGTVRVFVPGFDFPRDEQAAALPVRRALTDAVVGRRVQLAGVRALELSSFRGLVPSALGKAEMQVRGDGTVRAGRRGARTAVRAFPKSELVTLLPSVFQGETKSAALEIAPLRFDAQRRQLVLAKRVRVKLLFTGREPGESGRGSFGRAPRTRKAAVTGEVLARLHTTRQGLHAVSFEELFPGQRRGASVSGLRLERQGEAVAYHVEPATSTFGPGSRLYFFADEAAGSTDYSAEVAYELLSSREGLQMPIASAAAGSGAISSESVVTRVFEVERFYQPGLLDAVDPWLWEALATGATRAQSFPLAGVLGSGTATLDVDLQGASESGEPIDHHVSVSLNGSLVGEARFAGKRPHRISLGVAASLLREGANELALTNVGDTGVSSLVFLDRFTLSHPQPSSAAGGSFEGVWPQSGTATVSGVSGAPAVVELTASSASGASGSSLAPPRWLSGYSASGGALSFHAEAGRTYLVVSQPLSPRVSRPEPSTLRAATNQADYLLIAPRAFLAAAEPLVARRRDQGLAARAVAFEEITAEFGHGQPSAEAIRSFLSHAFHAWSRPSPRYVLLLGDSTYDPRNFSGVSQPSPLPVLWTKTSYLWTASDPLLAAVNGEDGLPDLAIGRLPATTLEQAEALVAKLVAWEDSGQGLAGAAALVADNPDLAGDFEADVEDIRSSFLTDRETTVLKLGELGAAMRPSIQAALDGGLSFLGYVGHGGAAVWASENVWNSWDAPSLMAQSRQPLLVTMNCLNGYFVAPSYESLSESLLKAEGRGAIASFSPSGLSLDGPAHQYHRALMAELTDGRHTRLGDAVVAAQKSYAETGLMPELLGIYHLLGDPAMPIR